MMSSWSCQSITEFAHYHFTQKKYNEEGNSTPR